MEISSEVGEVDQEALVKDAIRGNSSEDKVRELHLQHLAIIASQMIEHAQNLEETTSSKFNLPDTV